MKKSYQKRIEKVVEAIRDADKILIGAGAGLSSAAGLEYDGKRFEENFGDFIQKYGLTDMYSSGFYDFATEEEKWAYWSRHIKLNRFDELENKVYPTLLKLINKKEHFVITTNADGLFERSGFDIDRLFVVQGNYAKLQCFSPCHNKLYDNEEQIKQMVREQKNCKIPSSLIPKCPVCGGNMEVNVRKDASFVEDDTWHISYRKYENFVNSFEDENIVLMELGVGYNTPSIIKYPFEHLTAENQNATLIRANKEENEISLVNKDKTLVFGECISGVFEDLRVYM